MTNQTILYDLSAIIEEDLVPQSEAVAEAVEREPEAVARAMTAPGARYARGELSQGAYWDQIALSLGLEDTDVLAAYSENGARVDSELLARIRAQAATHTLGLLSDATPDWVGRWRQEHQLDRLFSVHIIDSELAGQHSYDQLLKLAAERLQATPGEVWFVDRKPAHLAAAQQVGMHPIDLAGTPDYRRAFAALSET